MKKARMPFQVLSLDGELLVEEEKDLELAFKKRTWTSAQRVRDNKRRCWHKNKLKYAAQRKAKDATISGRYFAAKRKALSVGQGWDFKEEEWQQLWIDAGFVQIPGTAAPSNPQGERRTAYALRGPNKHDNTYMARLDLGRSWNKDNCYIGFRGAELVGSRYHIKGL